MHWVDPHVEVVGLHVIILARIGDLGGPGSPGMMETGQGEKEQDPRHADSVLPCPDQDGQRRFPPFRRPV